MLHTMDQATRGPTEYLPNSEVSKKLSTYTNSLSSKLEEKLQNVPEDQRSVFYSKDLEEFLKNEAELHVPLLQKVNPNIIPLSPDNPILQYRNYSQNPEASNSFTPFQIFGYKKTFNKKDPAFSVKGKNDDNHKNLKKRGKFNDKVNKKDKNSPMLIKTTTLSSQEKKKEKDVLDTFVRNVSFKGTIKSLMMLNTPNSAPCRDQVYQQDLCAVTKSLLNIKGPRVRRSKRIFSRNFSPMTSLREINTSGEQTKAESTSSGAIKEEFTSKEYKDFSSEDDVEEETVQLEAFPDNKRISKNSICVCQNTARAMAYNSIFKRLICSCMSTAVANFQSVVFDLVAIAKEKSKSESHIENRTIVHDSPIPGNHKELGFPNHAEKI